MKDYKIMTKTIFVTQVSEEFDDDRWIDIRSCDNFNKAGFSFSALISGDSNRKFRLIERNVIEKVLIAKRDRLQ